MVLCPSTMEVTASTMGGTNKRMEEIMVKTASTRKIMTRKWLEATLHATCGPLSNTNVDDEDKLLGFKVSDHVEPSMF